MLPRNVPDEWRQRLTIALMRYEESKRLVGDTAVQRVKFPSVDADVAHGLALREETEALREYKNILLAFFRLASDSERPAE